MKRVALYDDNNIRSLLSYLLQVRFELKLDEKTDDDDESFLYLKETQFDIVD